MEGLIEPYEAPVRSVVKQLRLPDLQDVSVLAC